MTRLKCGVLFLTTANSPLSSTLSIQSVEIIICDTWMKYFDLMFKFLTAKGRYLGDI